MAFPMGSKTKMRQWIDLINEAQHGRTRVITCTWNGNETLDVFGRGISVVRLLSACISLSVVIAGKVPAMGAAQ